MHQRLCQNQASEVSQVFEVEQTLVSGNHCQAAEPAQWSHWSPPLGQPKNPCRSHSCWSSATRSRPTSGHCWSWTYGNQKVKHENETSATNEKEKTETEILPRNYVSSAIPVRAVNFNIEIVRLQQITDFAQGLQGGIPLAYPHRVALRFGRWNLCHGH